MTLDPPATTATAAAPPAVSRSARRWPTAISARCSCRSVLRVWLVGRGETAIGAYWPIKGEFDALPALYRWTEADDGSRPHRAAGGRPARPGSCAFTSGTRAARWRKTRSAFPSPRTPRRSSRRCCCVPCVGLRARRLAPGLRRRLLRPHARDAVAAAVHGRAGLRARLHAVAGARAARRAAGRDPDRGRRGVAVRIDLSASGVNRPSAQAQALGRSPPSAADWFIV